MSGCLRYLGIAFWGISILCTACGASDERSGGELDMESADSTNTTTFEVISDATSPIPPTPELCSLYESEPDPLNFSGDDLEAQLHLLRSIETGSTNPWILEQVGGAADDIEPLVEAMLVNNEDLGDAAGRLDPDVADVALVRWRALSQESAVIAITLAGECGAAELAAERAAKEAAEERGPDEDIRTGVALVRTVETDHLRFDLPEGWTAEKQPDGGWESEGEEFWRLAVPESTEIEIELASRYEISHVYDPTGPPDTENWLAREGALSDPDLASGPVIWVRTASTANLAFNSPLKVWSEPSDLVEWGDQFEYTFGPIDPTAVGSFDGVATGDPKSVDRYWAIVVPGEVGLLIEVVPKKTAYDAEIAAIIGSFRLRS